MKKILWIIGIFLGICLEIYLGIFSGPWNFPSHNYSEVSSDLNRLNRNSQNALPHLETNTRPETKNKNITLHWDKRLEKNVLFMNRPDPDTGRKLKILDEILVSKNDNDPRLDYEFRNLTERTKNALKTRYQSYPKEAFNERGTVIFLLGQNLHNKSDLLFFRSVLAEPPCFGVSDCKKRLDQDGAKNEHSGINRVTTNYPQLMALKILEKKLHSESLRREIHQILQVAHQSQSEPVRRLATSISLRNPI